MGVECEQAYDGLFNVIGNDQVDPTNKIDPSKSNVLISDNFTPLLLTFSEMSKVLKTNYC